MGRREFITFLNGASLALFIATAADAQVLKTVKDRGALNCGVSEGVYGFSARDSNGNPTSDTYTTPSIIWRLEG